MKVSLTPYCFDATYKICKALTKIYLAIGRQIIPFAIQGIRLLFTIIVVNQVSLMILKTQTENESSDLNATDN